MGWLDVAGAAGRGVEGLFGTPDAQRARDLKMLQLGQNLALHKEELIRLTEMTGAHERGGR